MTAKGGTGHLEAEGCGHAEGTPFGEAEKLEASEEAGR